MWFKIKYLLYCKWLDLVYLWPNFKFRVHRMYQFVTLGYRDCDWDYSFLMRLLKFKLEKMAVCHANDKWHLNAKDRASELYAIVAALDRLEDDSYAQELLPHRDFKKGKPSKKEISDYKAFEAAYAVLVAKDEDIVFNGLRKYYRGFWC